MLEPLLTAPKPFYDRVLLKISGEALMGDGKYGISPDTLERIAVQVREATQLGTQIGIVVGGGNIFRGIAASAKGMDRASADYMGMLATVMNAIALQDSLEKLGTKTRVLSAIAMQELCEPYIRRRAVRHLEKDRIVIFAAGTGNPYFTTDTAAALRAMEIGAQIIMKATKVDGVYTADPKKDPTATRYDRLSYMEVLQKRLEVMDQTAISLCREHDLPILVFDMTDPSNIVRAVRGENIGTIVGKSAANVS